MPLADIPAGRAIRASAVIAHLHGAQVAPCRQAPSVAQSASVATKRKSGVVKNQPNQKKRKTSLVSCFL
jgi:hypothetical protein